MDFVASWVFILKWLDYTEWLFVRGSCRARYKLHEGRDHGDLVYQCISEGREMLSLGNSFIPSALNNL